MTAPAIANRTPAARIREARRRLLDGGDLDHALIGPGLVASWQRSLRFGLAPEGRAPGAPHASGAQLARALEHRRTLVAHARPVMEFLCEHIRDTDSMVILADAQGMLLHSLGDSGFADKAARVALRPGAIWHEQWRGTNAIGTALAERAPVVVHGAEHFLERNAFLTCAATPIVDPQGRLLGVLDISGDQRGYHRHTLGLVQSAARMIENRLFEVRHGAGRLVRLHAHPEGLGTLTEGLLAVTEDGCIVGANAAALALLALRVDEIGATGLDRVLPGALPWAAAAGRGSAEMPRPLRRDDGSVLWMRADVARHVPIVAVDAADRTGSRGRSAAEPPATGASPGADAPVACRTDETAARRAAGNDALAALDTGDGAMQAVIGRARRVLDKPITVLVQGESGAGKEVFAKACHQSGSRRDAPFVAVNCAALPESLIEAELFGYRAGAFTGAARDGAPGRIREAHGGTLFLDEIGDMPLAMQARLLRVLQDREVVPLGGGKAVAVDFQLVCATHRRLRDDVDAGRFREDLYYRINGLTLSLPPLRERTDVDAIVRKLLLELAPDRPVELAGDVRAAFARYRWPGNLRQLCNVLRTACALLGDDECVIDGSHLPDDVAEELVAASRAGRHDAGDDPDDASADIDLRAQSARCIEQAVRESGGNMSQAARRLGISRNTLYRKLREAGGR